MGAGLGRCSTSDMTQSAGSGEYSRGGSAEQPNDPLWRVSAYRLAIEIADQAWRDSEKLGAQHHTRSLADQLYRAVGSIAANLAEGYSRSSGKDRVRMLEYALGSARECKVWYHLSRHMLDPNEVSQRQIHLDRICQLLLATIPQERSRIIRKTTNPE